MALIRWEPARELQTIQQEMNRLFGTFFDTREGGRGGNGGTLRGWIPAMDLVEEGDHFVLRADLPGVREEDVNIELEDNVLTISGERKAEHEDRKEGYYRVERAVGAFSRSLTLPEGIDPERIEAQFENGVLTVKIPKPEEQKARRVAINVGNTPAIEGSGRDASGQREGSGGQGSASQASGGAAGGAGSGGESSRREGAVSSPAGGRS